MRGGAIGVAASLVAVTLLGGCADEEPLEYVALGDSFTAGPLIPVTAESGGCLRSDHNYPSLLAERAQLDLVDVSCSGASTDHLVAAQTIGANEPRPPQLDALSTTTDLVTIGIGANDDDFALDWLHTCSELAGDDPSGSPCRTLDAAQEVTMRERLAVMTSSLTRGISLIEETSPDSRILVIGYPQIVPPAGTCRRRLPLATGDYPWARDLNVALRDAVVSAARSARVEVVDTWEISEGHDICSDEPWFNGRRTDPDRALAFHPFLDYQEAVADLVAERL